VTDCTACRSVKNVSVFAVKYDFVERLVWYSALLRAAAGARVVSQSLCRFSTGKSEEQD
jgi:hypothetical protein